MTWFYLYLAVGVILHFLILYIEGEITAVELFVTPFVALLWPMIITCLVIEFFASNQYAVIWKRKLK